MKHLSIKDIARIAGAALPAENHARDALLLYVLPGSARHKLLGFTRAVYVLLQWLTLNANDCQQLADHSSSYSSQLLHLQACSQRRSSSRQFMFGECQMSRLLAACCLRVDNRAPCMLLCCVSGYVSVPHTTMDRLLP